MKADEKFDLSFKILTVGESGVGKTSLLLQYVESNFNESLLSTVGIDFKCRTVEVDNKKVRLQIWDTAGQERFHSMASWYFRDANGLVLVYDITHLRSFERVSGWVDNVRKSAPQDVVIFLVGNKSDKQYKRVVSHEKGQELAESYNIKFFETSAKMGTGVNEVFKDLTQCIYNNWKSQRRATPPSPTVTQLQSPPSPKSSMCCGG